MITVSYKYNAYCAISKEGDNDIWTVRPRGVVPLLPLCSQIDDGATVNALLGDTFSRENNTHGSRFHDPDPQFASRILGAMTQSCYIGTRDIRSRVIRSPYCIIYVLYNTLIHWFWETNDIRCRAGSRLAPNQWETLQCNAVSHWLGANLESVLQWTPERENTHLNINDLVHMSDICWENV